MLRSSLCVAVFLDLQCNLNYFLTLTVSAKLSVKRSSRCHYGLLCAGEQVEYSPFSPAALHGSLLLSEAGHLSGPGQRKEIFNRTNAGRKKKG